ncbi:hypothetical protein F4803DRAFT_569855 [Xylaria telfairii]|nr:hypothetical protein F4803DRAFT_569855 [Xylaria telfairii]
MGLATYHSTVKAGILSQNVVPVQASRSPQSWQPLSSDLTQEKGLSQSELPSIEFDSSSPIERSDLTLVSHATGHEFNLSQPAVAGISSFAQQTFAILDSFLTLNCTSCAYSPSRWDGAYGKTGSTFFRPSLLQILFNSDDVNSTFTALATSMSNTIKNSADDIKTNGIPKEQVGQKQSFAVISVLEAQHLKLGSSRPRQLFQSPLLRVRHDLHLR